MQCLTDNKDIICIKNDFLTIQDRNINAFDNEHNMQRREEEILVDKLQLLIQKTAVLNKTNQVRYMQNYLQP